MKLLNFHVDCSESFISLFYLSLLEIIKRHGQITFKGHDERRKQKCKLKLEDEIFYPIVFFSVSTGILPSYMK